jgi:zinc protease
MHISGMTERGCIMTTIFPTRRVLLALLAALLAGTTGCLLQRPAGATPAVSPQEETLPVDPQILRGTLDNGLTYYVRRNAKPENRAELRLVVNAGSLQEDDSQQGLAHFTEHMAFNGTEGFEKQKIVDYLESIGMSFGPEVNASTSFDETIYKLLIPTDDPKVLETGVTILEEWAHRISFAPEEVVKERPVIVEEWRLRRGAEARMQDVQYPILFKNSRYSLRIPIGKMDIVEKATAEDLRRFYTDWYRPDLMAVIAVGDFNPDGIVTLIRQHFGRLASPANPRKRVVSPVPDTPGTLYAPATDPEATTTRVALYVKHEVQPVRTLADYRRQIVEAMYNGMLNARLDEIAQRSDASLASAGSASFRLVRSKQAYILAARVRDDRIREALESLLTEAERVRRHGFTDTELQREKKELLAQIEQYYADRDNIPSDVVAEFLIDNFLKEEPLTDVETDHRLYTLFVPEIGLDEVNRMAAVLLTQDNRVVLVNAPSKQAAAVPSEAQVHDVFQKVASGDVLPYEDRVATQPLFTGSLSEAAITSRTSIPEIGVTRWKLSNGVSVILKPTDFKKDEVLFAAYSPGGTSLVPDADYAAAFTAADIVAESGVGGLDATQLRKQLAGKNATVTPWIGDLDEGLKGSARPADLETLFQLISLYMTEPRKDPEAFQVYREKLKTSVENRASSPQGVFYDMVQDVLTQDHPRGRPWSLQRVQEMDLDASLRVYRERFKDAGDFTFFFVGSFSLERIEPYVRRYLGSLPAQGRGETWKDVGITPPRGIVRRQVKKGLEQQSRAEIVYTGTTAWSLESRLKLEALSQVLDIRLREVVREETGGSYDIGVDGAMERYPKPEYFFYIGFGCAPDQVESITALTLREIQRMREKGPEAVDVAKVKEILKREHEQNLKLNDYWLGTLQLVYTNALNPLTLLEFDKRLDSITVESVHGMATELLHPDNYAELVLYPESGSAAQ